MAERAAVGLVVAVVLRRVRRCGGAEESLRAVQEGRGACVSAGLGLGIGLGSSDQDALDGALGGVADRDRPRAGCLQPRLAVERIDLERSTTWRQASPISDARLRHQTGICIGKAVFSGG
ncbi:hypothetical protein ABT189_10740 [Streptomyces sp900105755]|uniref:hypothetical protein n=1 Tax=Streptomyces sp. 900105755 TaxID=3154389 RepID=UPI0033235F63